MKKLLVLLAIILIIVSISIYVIAKTPKYDKELYNQIYAEYEEIFEEQDIENTNLNSNIEEIYNNGEEIRYQRGSTQDEILKVVGQISIPSINISYPIIFETTDKYLEIAPTKLSGPNLNEKGNFCIVAHDYNNKDFFSNLYKLEKNDKIILTSNDGTQFVYIVYDKFEVDETDISVLSQETTKTECTLITCTDDDNKRLVIKAIYK